MPDHAQLEDALTRELHALADDLSVRGDLTEQTIVRRRRGRRRAQLAGAASVMAAAGVVTVLATGAGSGRSFPSDAQAPNPGTGGGQVHDTAYIVKRVNAAVAADGHDGTLIHNSDYGSGDVRSDGSIVNLRYREYDGYSYTAPDGAVYWRGTLYAGEDGTHFREIDDWIPRGDHKDTSIRILINLDRRIYSRNVYEDEAAPSGGPSPNLLSSPSQVQKALRDGQVAQKGTATIDGTRAIALSVRLKGPRVIDHETVTLTLYVDARTYQPLRTLYADDGHLNLEIDDWVTATPARIALAEDDSIPSGYTKVGKAY